MRHHRKTAIRPNLLPSLTLSVSPPAALPGPQGSAVYSRFPLQESGCGSADGN